MIIQQTDLAEIAEINTSTLKKYIALLLSIQDHPRYKKMGPIA